MKKLVYFITIFIVLSLNSSSFLYSMSYRQIAMNVTTQEGEEIVITMPTTDAQHYFKISKFNSDLFSCLYSSKRLDSERREFITEFVFKALSEGKGDIDINLIKKESNNSEVVVLTGKYQIMIKKKRGREQ